jgi:uncharacterized protein
MQADSSNADKRKLLSAVSHGSIFISSLLVSIVIPIGIYSVSDDLVVKNNAKEAINFHFNVWLIGGIITVLTIVTFGILGFFLAPIWLLYHWGMSIWAISHCLQQPDKEFHYPLIWRVF